MDRIRATGGTWFHRPPAEVLHGTFQGRFVAITIRVRGSRWVCHPHPEGDEWAITGRGRALRGRNGRGPSRHVRKIAKMVLRRWLNS